jgi:hypothetical protein
MNPPERGAWAEDTGERTEGEGSRLGEGTRDNMEFIGQREKNGKFPRVFEDSLGLSRAYPGT